MRPAPLPVAMSTDPPSPPGLPLVGNTHQYTRNPFRFVSAVRDAYGDLTRARIGRGPVYVLTDPEAIGDVLVREEERYRKADFQRDVLGPLVGQGLLTSEGELWRNQRRRIQPAFFGDRLTGYAETVVDVTEDVTADWTDGQAVDVERAMTALTLRVISRTLFSADVSAERMERLHAAMRTVGERFELDTAAAFLPDWVPTPEERDYEAAVRHLERLVGDLIDRHRRAEDPPDDLVTMLLAAQAEAPDEVTDAQLRDEVMTMLLAGHDTTALTLTYAWHLLSEHPESARRLRAEARSVIGDRDPTFGDLRDLEYTGWVVNESMRLYPPVYALWRSPEEAVELCGYEVPADAVVMLPQYAVHRDGRWFDEPRAFRPERWADPDHPDHAYFPFGAGSRVCVGNRFAQMEAKLVLAMVARDWTVETAPSGELSLQASITAHPRGGLQGTVRRAPATEAAEGSGSGSETATD